MAPDIIFIIITMIIMVIMRFIISPMSIWVEVVNPVVISEPPKFFRSRLSQTYADDNPPIAPLIIFIIMTMIIIVIMRFIISPMSIWVEVVVAGIVADCSPIVEDCSPLMFVICSAFIALYNPPFTLLMRSDAAI